MLAITKKIFEIRLNLNKIYIIFYIITFESVFVLLEELEDANRNPLIGHRAEVERVGSPIQ